MTSKNNQTEQAALSADTTGSPQENSGQAPSTSSGQVLRRQAEAKLSERKKKAAALPAPETDTQRLIHELEVHQIELEMQNEELVQSRAQVEAGLRRYTDLYDFAPVGYFTLALDGAIHQVNLAGANLLGVERGALIKRRFGVFVSARSRITFSAFLEKVFSTSGSKETCEVTLQKDGPAPLWVHIEAMTEDGQRKTCRAVVLDITERKQAEEALRESETLFRKLFEDHAAVELIVDPNTGNIIDANEAAAVFYGWSREQLKQTKIQEINTLSPEEVKKEMEKARARKKIHFEFRHRRADGSVRDVDVFSSKIEVKGKDLLHSIVHDITDRKLAEEALRESEKKYRLHFENVTDVIFSIDQELRLLDITPSVEKVLGYRPEEMIGKPIHQFQVLAVDHQEEAYSDIRHVLAGNNIQAKVYEFIAKDGTLRFCEVGAALLLQDGRAVAVICAARDITERKQAEEWLLRERSMVDRIMKTSPAGIIVVNRDGSIIFANKRAGEIYGLAADEMTRLAYNSPEWRITDFDGNPFPIEKLPHAMVISSGSPVYGIRHAIQSPEGRRVYLSINGAPIHDENGNSNEVVFTVNDVTERKQTEEKLKDTLASLRNALNTIIQVMVSAVEVRDPYTAGHQIRSADLARAIATEMGLPLEKIDAIRMAGSIHDIGKLSIPAEILSKPTKLSEIELSLIKEHARKGYEMLKDVESPWPLAEIVHQHHERMDGSGYPRNLKGEEICIEARILSVADVVEAMASHRPYRPGLGIDAALNEIEKNRGIFYDDAVADACLRLFREKGFQLEGT